MRLVYGYAGIQASSNVRESSGIRLIGTRTLTLDISQGDGQEVCGKMVPESQERPKNVRTRGGINNLRILASRIFTPKKRIFRKLPGPVPRSEEEHTSELQSL